MSVPDPGQVRVATDALRGDAAAWDGQGRVVAALGARAADLSVTRIEAGMFQVVLDAYREAQTQVTRRCGEGGEAMASVARTLHDVADTYDREEAALLHQLRNLY